jgi:hypothetical protein
MSSVYLVYSDNNEDYEMHSVDLIGVYPLDRLEDAKAHVDRACYVRKGWSREKGAPPFVGNTVYIEQWDMVAQCQMGQEPVYRRAKYAEANEAAKEVASSVDRDYQRELDLIANAKERDKLQRLANRLQVLGVDVD